MTLSFKFTGIISLRNKISQGQERQMWLLKKLEIILRVWFKLGKQPGLIHVGEPRVKGDSLLERSRVRHRNRVRYLKERNFVAARSRTNSSVADTNLDPPDPHVFGPPGSGSGSISQSYGSGSFYHKAKIVRKTLIPTAF